MLRFDKPHSMVLDRSCRGVRSVQKGPIGLDLLSAGRRISGRSADPEPGTSVLRGHRRHPRLRPDPRFKDVFCRRGENADRGTLCRA